MKKYCFTWHHTPTAGEHCCSEQFAIYLFYGGCLGVISDLSD